MANMITGIEQAGPGIFNEKLATRTPLSAQLCEKVSEIEISKSLWDLGVKDVIPQEGGTKLLLFPRSIPIPISLYQQYSGEELKSKILEFQSDQQGLDLVAIAALLQPFSPELVISHENAMKFIL